MNTTKNKATDLTDRNEEIVDLVARYGLMIASALQGWYGQLSVDAARKVLERLTADGWLDRHRLSSGGTYFVLSTSACNRLNLKRHGMALRQRALIRRCLVLFYFSQRPHLTLLTATECKASLPAIYRRGAANFYFVDTNTGSLGWLCLDDGKQPIRVRTKTSQVAAKRRLIPQIRELIVREKFYLVVLTTTEAKAAQLATLFSARPLRDVPVEIASAAACAELLVPPH